MPPNTGTTSTRVRSLVLRSPWVFIALFGLIVAGAVVWVGARRSRRPRDVVVPAGELDADVDGAQVASRPVIKRLGADAGSRAGVLERVRASAGASRRRDDRPLLDDAFLVEVDPDGGAEAEAPDEDDASSDRAAAASEQKRRTPARTGKASAKPAGRAPSKPKVPSKAKGGPGKAKGAAKARAPAKTKARSGAKAPAKSKAKRSTPAKQAKPKPRTAQKGEANFIPLKEL